MKEFFKDFKYNLLILIAFFTSIILIYSTYAWFSSTLNVDITFFKISAGTETGLSFSLDGVNWTNELTISKETIIDNLNNIYPNHTNQWSDSLTTVSSVGIYTPNNDRFTFLGGNYNSTEILTDRSYHLIDSYYLSEDEPNDNSKFVAFDLFFKNISNSPYPDNLFLSNSTSFVNSSENENIALNGLRLGFVFYDSISKRSSVNQIQNIGCGISCTDMIIEPNSRNHTVSSINIARDHGVLLNDGIDYPTYAMIKENTKINIWSGIHNSNTPYDDSMFLFQKTVTNYSEPITQIPDGIMKVRVYLWIEAQDIDVISTESDGYKIIVKLDFEKDLAGYSNY